MHFYRVYIEITNICGLSCSFCPPKLNPNKTISLEFFDSILKQLRAYTKTLAFHVFGDPLTLSNLSEYLDIAYKYGFDVELTTSGFYLKYHSMDTIFHQSVRQLNISLNSFNKNSSNLSFDEYMSEIFRVISNKSDKAFINLRLWNIDDAYSEREFNTKVIQKLEDFYKTKIDFGRLSSKVLLVKDSYFEWPDLKSAHYSEGFCYGLESHFGILSDGRVVPCCLDGEGVVTLGNLHNSTLEQILNSLLVKEIKEGFKIGKCTQELCKKCSYKDRFAKGW